MKISALFMIAILVLSFGCKKKEESTISAEEIIKGMDSLATTKKENTEIAANETFDEPEELSSAKKVTQNEALTKAVSEPVKETEKVKTEPVVQQKKPETTVPNVPASANGYTFTPDGYYTLQVHVYSMRQPAEKLSEKLSQLGYRSYVAEIESPQPQLSGIQYRVRVGAFRTRAEAEKCGQEIKEKLTLDYWIDYRKNDNTTENYSTSAGSSYQPAAAPEPEPAPYVPPAAEPVQTYTPPPAEPAPAPAPVPEPAAPVPAQTTSPAPPAPAPTPAQPATNKPPVSNNPSSTPQKFEF
ncbi:MAG: SPOR domain-containing protein [Fibrobacteres bacterium]|nr:SPOR domain-containing protein [Fibrobacterota bacterium]